MAPVTKPIAGVSGQLQRPLSGVHQELIPGGRHTHHIGKSPMKRAGAWRRIWAAAAIPSRKTAPIAELGARGYVGTASARCVMAWLELTRSGRDSRELPSRPARWKSASRPRRGTTPSRSGTSQFDAHGREWNEYADDGRCGWRLGPDPAVVRGLTRTRKTADERDAAVSHRRGDTGLVAAGHTFGFLSFTPPTPEGVRCAMPDSTTCILLRAARP